MALSNFLFSGSYVRIERFTFSKYDKWINCSLQIINKEKSSCASREIVLHGNCTVQSVCIVDRPPTTPKDIFYFIKEGSQGIWSAYSKHIAHWNNQKLDWDYWYANSWHDILYFEDEKRYCRINEGIFETVPCYNDIRLWDLFFSSSALEGSNHLKQAYLFLKSLDEFNGCEDC